VAIRRDFESYGTPGAGWALFWDWSAGFLWLSGFSFKEINHCTTGFKIQGLL